MAGNKIQIVATAKDEVSGPLAKMKDQFNTLGKTKGFQAVAQGVGIGAGITGLGLLSQGISKVTDAMFGAIRDASDLNETITKSQVVFGSSADKIEAFGKTAARSMGLSENAAIAAAASIGNLLLSTGTAEEKIAPMSQGLVKLASDLASFNNIAVEDALAKLQSGLVGQERPLRELGVAISAASVDTEALVLGFKKVNGEFTEGQKVQARYSLIFKQTKTAQGDFARTSDGLANSQRILNAELDDTSARIGTELLPIFVELAHVVSRDVVPGVVSLVESLHSLKTNTDREVHQIGDIWENVFGRSIGLYLDSADQKALKSGQIWSQATSDMVTNVEHMRGEFASNFAQIEGTITGSAVAARKAVQVLPNRMAGDLRGGWSAVHDAAVALGEAMSKPIKAAAREKVLMDVLTGKGSVGRLLTKGLVSANPFAVEAARKLYADTIAELDAFRDFRIVVSAVIGGGAGKGGGQGPHSAPTRAPSHGPHRGSSTSGGSTGGSSGGHTININTLFPPSAQHKAELSRLLHELLAPDRELGSYSPG